MSSERAARLVGEWVGVIELGGTTRFVKARWHDDGQLTGSLDLPNELTFRQPLIGVRLRDAQLVFGVLTEHGDLRFDVRLAGDQLRGVVRQGTSRGTVQLARLSTLDLPTAAGYVGTYRAAPDETILVALGEDAPDKRLLYAHGDRLVRLYPLASGALLSELGETIVPVSNEMEETTGFRWQGDQAHELPKVELYREEAVQFENGDVTLAGTVLVPPGDGPHPGVVLMHGSLPGERDFYRVYADRFARRGIAALIYDKRGFGASTRNVRSTIRLRAEDGLSGLRLLRARSEIDPRRVGLWGFSNATWSLPVAAASSADVAFLVAVGAAGVTMARAETHRKVAELREWNISEATLADVVRGWEILYEWAATGRWSDAWDEGWDALVERLRADEALAQVPLQDYARANPWLSPIPLLLPADDLKARSFQASSEMGFDPVTAYEQVTCPVLYLVGENDENLPAGESATRVGEALRRAGNPDYTVKVLPGASHMLNLTHPRITGMASTEASGDLHDFRFSPGYLDLVTDWILAHVGPQA